MGRKEVRIPLDDGGIGSSSLALKWAMPGLGACMLEASYGHSLYFSLTMKSQSTLEFSDVKAMAAAAEAEALKNNWAVTIAIVDAGGHLLHLARLDGAAPMSSHIAPAKANAAALGRRESKIYEDLINAGRISFLSAPTIQGMLEGGVPIMKDGHCLGAVGVSGVKSSEDAQIAKAGIAAIGL